MGKVLQISIYSLLLILVFLLFGTILKSCGSSAVDAVTDTASEVTDNIQKAGGEVVAKAESTMDNIVEEFEGDDIDFSSTESETKSYDSSDDAESPSYVQDDAPAYNPPEDVVEETVKKLEEKKPEPPRSSSTSSSSTSGSSRGNYLLITGNYSQETNAKAMVKKLKDKGYSNAESVIFEGSRYYTVIAGKYPSMSSANSAMSKLGGIDAYVQKKRL